MRICFHTNFEVSHNYIGGTERFLIKLSKELQIFGHEPFIVCSSLEEETEVEGIKVLGRVPNKIRKTFEKYAYFSSTFIKNEIIGDQYSPDSLKRLSDYTAGQIDNVNADIINLNSFASASFLSPSMNYVATNHENEREYDSYWGHGFFEMLCNQVKNRHSELHNYKALLTPSRYYANEFSSRFNLPVTAIQLGVHLCDFALPRQRNLQKKEYFGSENELVILLPSRFQTKQKGHDIALYACQILKNKGISFKIVFTGVKKSSEKYLPDFRALVEQLNLTDNVIIMSFADIQTAYSNSDIIISPEKYCSYGLSISESLALGMPTVLSDIPTYKEIAEGFDHAIFFKSESYEDLANKLLDVIRSGHLQSRKDAIKFRIQNDLRLCARNYATLYNSLKD